MNFKKLIEYDFLRYREVEEEDYEELINNGLHILKTNNPSYLNIINPNNIYQSKNELGKIIEEKYKFSKLKEQLEHTISTGFQLLTDEIFKMSFFNFIQEKHNTIESFPFFNELLYNAITVDGKTDYLILAYKKLSSQLFLPLFQTYFYKIQDLDSEWVFKLKLQRKIAKSLMYLDCNNYSDKEIFLYCKPYEYSPPIIWELSSEENFDNSEIQVRNENFECDISYISYTEEYYARIKVKENELIFFDKKEGYALYFLESFPPKNK